jgi:hypothetical protein
MTERLQFGVPIPLETYLDNADPDALNDHDKLSNIVRHIDPRVMLFKALSERLMPLAKEDLFGLNKYALIKRADPLETISFGFPYSIIDDLEWCDVLGDPLNTVEVFAVNLNTKILGTEDWKLLFLKRDLHHQGDNDDEFSFGWVNQEELARLRELAAIGKETP